MRKNIKEKIEQEKDLATDLEVTEEDRIMQELDYQDTRRELSDFIEIIEIN